MQRRKFIKVGLSGLGITAWIGKTAANSIVEKDTPTTNVQDLIILHTNDVHSRIDPFPDTDQKYGGKGGVAKRKTMIEQIRSQNKHVLLFDCGDIFQGTPYFNLYGGEVELKAMSDMKYDAATMGNHDFDNGLDGFLNVFKFADFPFLCANYDFSDTVLAGKTEGFRIFNKGKLKIGVFGIGIELKGLVPDKLYGNTKYLDPILTANTVAKKLKDDYKCDAVICLSHLGFKYDNDKVSDLVLARKSNNIDVILGGHTHTFLSQPVIEKNASNKNILINQVGWAGINLGVISLSFKKIDKRKENYSEISYIARENQEIS